MKEAEEKVEAREEIKKPLLGATSRRNIFDGQQMIAASMTRGKELYVLQLPCVIMYMLANNNNLVSFCLLAAPNQPIPSSPIVLS